MRRSAFIKWFKPRIIVNMEYQGCCLIPKWYGVAYKETSTYNLIMWWIPINIIVKFVHSAYIFLKQGGYSPNKRKLITTEIEELKFTVKEQQEKIQKLIKYIYEIKGACNALRD